MRHFFSKLTSAVNTLTLRALVAAQVFATTEPVRARALLVSLFMAGAVLVPALANEGTAQTVASVVVVALPLIAGESTRAKVTPAK
jgi:hypothetical protein